MHHIRATDSYIRGSNGTSNGLTPMLRVSIEQLLSVLQIICTYVKLTNLLSFAHAMTLSQVFNDTTRYVDQGGGKRKGSFAVYLEPWHADIFGFLDLRKNHGNELERARDLFYGLWVPDLFMRRVEKVRTAKLFLLR